MFEQDEGSNKAPDGTFTGTEKRTENRRKVIDRRKDIRFEPDKEDRRQNPGRRESDKDPWFRHNE